MTTKQKPSVPVATFTLVVEYDHKNFIEAVCELENLVGEAKDWGKIVKSELVIAKNVVIKID